MLMGVAYVTVIERKILAILQRRIGPNTVGFYGLLQPFSDALKLILKETVVPYHANKFLFFLAPILTLVLSLLG
jgi:NADH-ubiquinone oxidoreductase chain 1